MEPWFRVRVRVRVRVRAYGWRSGKKGGLAGCWRSG